jgi:hypothetical protein
MRFRRRKDDHDLVGQTAVLKLGGGTSDRCFFCGERVRPRLALQLRGATLWIHSPDFPDGFMTWECHRECVEPLRHAKAEWPT